MRNTLSSFISHSIIQLFTDGYHIYYENMRNENEKSFAVCVVMNGTFPIFSESATNRIRILDNTNHNVLIGNYMP